AELHQVAAALRRMLTLSRADGDSAGRAYVAHVPCVVAPDARLLEPADVEVTDTPAELDRLGARVALIRVDRQNEVVAPGLAGGFDALRILCRRLAADLELAPTEAELAPLGHFLADAGEIGAVVAADDVDTERVAVAAPKLEERPVERLADRIPEREVDARQSDE